VDEQLIADTVLTTFCDWSHDTGRTFDGLMKRLEASLTGKRLIVNLSGNQRRYEHYMTNETTKAYEGVLNIATGARDEGDVSGSE
jgi:hypothetical protein